jgi:phosphate transport system permease protein
MSAPSVVLGSEGDARRRRRRLVNLLVTGLLALVVAAVLALLVWVLVYVAIKGARVINGGFFTDTPPGNPSDRGGGFENGIVGSLIIVGLATAMSVPLGVAAAVYLAEYGEKRLASIVRFLADVMLGIPSIVTGAFVYSLWVLRYGFSGYAGAIALALVMFPLVIRASEEMLRLVPNEHREASLALGTGRAKTTIFVVLPIALSGITTGVMLAVARAMGETAPLLLTALGNDLFLQTNPGERMSTLSLQIFGNAITGFQEAQARAWGGALTLIGIVLIFTVVARLSGRRSVVTAR